MQERVQSETSEFCKDLSMNLSTIVQYLRKTQQLPAGVWVLLGVFFSLISSLYAPAIIIASILYWLASYQLRSKISTRNAIQSLVLVSIGVCLCIIAYGQDQRVSLLEILEANVTIVSMLAGVSFLTMISQPKIGQKESLPIGNRTIISTFLGVHLFGAVINMSSVFIHADRMSANRALSPGQLMVLTRGFSCGAFWSPFFAAMAVALSYVPSANLALLMLIGGCISVLAMCFTFFEIKYRHSDTLFYGFPLRVNSLLLPSLLTALVFIIHYLFHDLSILFIITLCSPLLCLVFLAFKANPKELIQQHIEKRLSNMQNEIVLFLSAGVFGVGLNAILSNQSWFAPFNVFDASAASVCFMLMIGLSMLGFHMLIGISIVAPMVLPLDPDPSLLAFIILASWAIGAAVGPLSGMNISIQGTYGVSSHKIQRWNFRYALVMTTVVIAVIFVLDKFLL